MTPVIGADGNMAGFDVS